VKRINATARKVAGALKDSKGGRRRKKSIFAARNSVAATNFTDPEGMFGGDPHWVVLW
jgi:hypothetical protein